MKPSFFNFSIQDFEHIKSLQQLRERLLNRLLFSAFVIGTALLVVAMIPALQRGLVEIVAIYTVIYLWLIVVTFARRLPSNRWAAGWLTVRIASWLSFLFVLGLVNLYLSGFNADAGLFFLTFVAMSALLFDLRRGLLAFGLSLAFILLFGYLTVSGRFELLMESPQPANPLLWIIGGTVFLVTGIPLIIAFTALVRGLVVHLDRVTTEAEKLEDANLALQETRDDLENKIRQRAAELASASERLRELLARSPAVIFAARYEENYPANFYSDNIRDLLGYTPEQFTSDPKFWRDRIHPQDVEGVLAEAARLTRTGTATLEYRFLHRDGAYRWTRETIRLIRSPQGEPLELVGSWMDISAQKQAEESYKILLENSIQGIVVLQEERIVYANPAVTNMFGYTLDFMKALTPEQINAMFHPADQAMLLRRLQDRREGRPLPERFELRVPHRNGDLRFIEASATPILYGGRPALQTTVIDLTERKLMEQSLAQARDELEERVVERTWKLLETQEQLRNLAKEVILAQEQERRHVSRELHDEAGQALISMKYGLESILPELPADNPHIQQRLASSLQQLDQTMEKIRQLAHSLRPPLFDIADLDLTIKDYCREFGESTGLQIEYNGVPVPDLSEEAGLSFFRFLQEALTNIVKHAKATRVEVKLSQQDRQLSLSVADNGIGAPDTRSDGHGHIGMRERFMMLGGVVQIQSRGQAGFAITASIPFGVKHNQAGAPS